MPLFFTEHETGLTISNLTQGNFNTSRDIVTIYSLGLKPDELRRLGFAVRYEELELNPENLQYEPQHTQRRTPVNRWQPNGLRLETAVYEGYPVEDILDSQDAQNIVTYSGIEVPDFLEEDSKRSLLVDHRSLDGMEVILTEQMVRVTDKRLLRTIVRRGTLSNLPPSSTHGEAYEGA